MQIYDVLMLAVVMGAALLGFRKGLAWQVASLASIFLSYAVAVRFRDPVAGWLNTPAPWNTFLAMLLLYLATSLAIWIVFQLISGLIDRAKLKEFDRQLGALFGAAKGALLCVIITLFAVTLLDESQRQQIIYSRSGYYIARLLNRSEGVIPPELHELLDPYLHRLDERLDGEVAGPGGADRPTAPTLADFPWVEPHQDDSGARIGTDEIQWYPQQATTQSPRAAY